MGDDEYLAFLKALARKHIVHHALRGDTHMAMHLAEGLRDDLARVSALSRLMIAVRDRPTDEGLLQRFVEEAKTLAPIERAAKAMEQTGILDALEEGGVVLFTDLRRTALPPEDYQFLREAGFTDDDIDILVAVAIGSARQTVSPSALRDDLTAATKQLNEALQQLQQLAQTATQPLPKKRKLFNGIGKILGGVAAGLGNGLMAAGTIVAPNPATAYGAIASGAFAVSAIFGGVGDLRDE